MILHNVALFALSEHQVRSCDLPTDKPWYRRLGAAVQVVHGAWSVCQIHFRVFRCLSWTRVS